MDENSRFHLVFAKLVAAMEGGVQSELLDAGADVRCNEVTKEELDEIGELRRIVLEVTEPEPVSFTIT